MGRRFKLIIVRIDHPTFLESNAAEWIDYEVRSRLAKNGTYLTVVGA